MVITYRRTGGLFMLLAVVAAALAAMVLTVAVAGTFLIVSAAIAAIALFGRAVLNATSSSDTRNLCRVHANTR